MNEIKNSNLARILVWIVSLAALTAIILKIIENKYNIYVVKQDSYSTYRVSIVIILFVTIGLSMLWWGIAGCKWKIRERMENRTCEWGICFTVVCFVAAGVIFTLFPGIELESGTLKHVFYVFCYPCIFGFNLFLASPNNVYKVIFPYSKWKNLLVSTMFVLIAIICVYIGGI